MTAGTTPRSTPGLDVAVAVVFACVAQLELWVFQADDVSRGASVGAAALMVVMAVGLAFRSTAPVPAYFSNGLAICAITLVGVPGDAYPFSNLVLLFTLAAVASTRVAAVGLVTGLGGVAYYFWTFGEQPLFGAFTMVLWALGWAAGRSTLARRTRLAVEHERDLSLAGAEARDARLALESQRRDIAREIHDMVGHTVNVMVVHAGAGRRALDGDGDGDTGDARTAFTTIEDVGRTALDELDNLLGLLGANPTERVPLPGIADLRDLVDRTAQSGLQVELCCDLADDLDAAKGAVIYRIVQEALTNTLRHADAHAARVDVRRDDGDVVVTVTDDGRGATTAPPGRGLAGMADRVALHLGSLQHGDQPGGGYCVAARVPLGAPT